MVSDLMHIIETVVKDKGISRDAIVEALETAILTAARKKLGPDRELEVSFNQDAGEVELFEFKEVVEDVTNPLKEISLEEGRALDPEAQTGDVLGIKIETESFGRIAAQTAKQVIIQKVRDAERLMIYDEYKDRVNELINGTVRRFERGNMVVDLGRAEAFIPHAEQVGRESYRVGDRIRAHVLAVHKEAKGPQIVLSRRAPEFVRKLFEMEVPEINEGIVEIVSVARDAGIRTKIAVRSLDTDVDPVGACVGMKGARVQAVVQELRGEKIDIISWSKDIATNVCNALAPAEVSRMIIDDEQNLVLVIVPDEQLSLAIGRKGQNVRLAVQLTGWNIDIKSESEMANLTKNAQETLGRIPGIGGIIAEKLYLEGFTSPEDLAEATPEDLTALPGIGRVKAEKLLAAVREYLENKEPEQGEGHEEKAEEGEDEDGGNGSESRSASSSE